MPTAPAQADDAQIEGSGSTWSQVIFDQWIADVAPRGIRVAYSGVGSSTGRKDFANSTTDFAISEVPYQGIDELGNPDNANGREYAYVPIVAGGTAFTYHLEQGGKLLTGIRLSGPTIAKIFTSAITSWADPAIAADNNGRSLPDTPIIPVVRSDGAGVTRQVTAWLDAVYPDIWRREGRTGATSYFPTSGRMVAAAGSDQVMNTVANPAGNGTIGYVEYSYPTNKGYPVVKLLNTAGFFVEPTQYNVAVALTQVQINQDQSSPLYLTQVLTGVYANADPRAYPLSSYSYMILPVGSADRRLTTAKRQALADLTSFALCDGQSEAGPYGYSPLPLNLVQAGFDQLAKLKAADPAVDLQGRDLTQCHNPTFVAGDLARNYLAEIAPLPAPCDAVGADPCGVPTAPLGGVSVHLSVPAVPAVDGLTLGVGATSLAMAGTRGAASVHATAELAGLTVTDTRADDHLTTWQVNVQATPFTGLPGVIDAAYLGWRPAAPSSTLDTGSPLTVHAGPSVTSMLSDSGSSGLSATQLLAEAVVPGRGTTTLGATLDLVAPSVTLEGTYSSTLTVTLVSS
ncbi:phosphate ABC transporter substrate-binding protein PstS [Cellulomonas sp. ICMP 17802]|uniref:phosphate ABC transporter substrate-binding protein PstS n=1 Tax=Cellulomonas sp. ICMP 17802 TaxID=3239199 RepID=UPI00351B8022